MTDVEVRKYVVTGYQALGDRFFVQKNGDKTLATLMQIRLDIRQVGGPPGHHATLAVIEFGTGAEQFQIGSLAPRAPHSDQFGLDVSLPAADFNHYWTILTDIGQTHLRCEIERSPERNITDFQIMSRKHIETVPS